MTRRLLVVALLLTGAVAPPSASAAPAPTWSAPWSRPQSVALGASADLLDGGRGPGPLVDQAVRDVVRVTGGGTAVRVRLSNRYGAGPTPTDATPLRVLAGSLARRASGPAVVARTLRNITFGGRRAVTIAPGATVVSDPVALPVAAGNDLAVSLHVQAALVAPAHGASFVTSYVAAPSTGDRTREVSGASFTQRTRSTLVLTGVDVRSTRLRGVVAVTGGSVVDGFGTASDSHTDLPAWLARRLVPQHRTVVNNGLGGTTAAKACNALGTGPSVQERVAHDSLALPGLTHLIVYAGTNDLGTGGCDAGTIIAAYRSIVAQARARGIRVLIATITPRASYSAAQNAERATVNAWVRGRGTCSGGCDRSLDFDAVVRDPTDPRRLAPALDSGDGIHPNGEGYRRLAASVPLL